MSNEWRPVLNTVLYMAQFSELDENEARRIAESLLAKPPGDFTIEKTYQSLADAIAAGEELDTIVQMRQSPQVIRKFLERIVDELDGKRPWTIPAVREISISRWADFASLQPIAQISTPWPAIEGKVGKTFKAVDGGEGLIVMLRSGITLGLAWPSRIGKSATDVLVPEGSAGSSVIVQELIESTALKIDDITILERG
ncbi:hypothetical protein NBRGN_010_00460 [Nocardia brasiliensis NBRC 14402]|uniref:hypothetical protein n=1 Tax=Nocardia brasiliensis TaxID=37326 RepID=UPI00045CAD5A|nr:hypothetical protein [Nocardia brasiliensis]GAJ79406.1 hypothetical protein NBRGN_010_00460 [Nocardia brasiliensis NBRC 14402]SUB11293.1 Uncharacterised protein [Nocardia brasiliensis]